MRTQPSSEMLKDLAAVVFNIITARYSIDIFHTGVFVAYSDHSIQVIVFNMPGLLASLEEV